MKAEIKTPPRIGGPTLLAETRHQPKPEAIRKALEKRSFATLATTSPAGRPHVAGVLYELVNDALYINTMRSSRKARNIAANSNVAVCVPVRRIPVGPPSTIQFQAAAEILALDSTEITALVEAGKLRSLTNHGELEMPDGCFLRVGLSPRVVTYGLGMSLSRLMSDPLNAGASAVLRDPG
jgi:hypothetical protein